MTLRELWQHPMTRHVTGLRTRGGRTIGLRMIFIGSCVLTFVLAIVLAILRARGVVDPTMATVAPMLAFGFAGTLMLVPALPRPHDVHLMRDAPVHPDVAFIGPLLATFAGMAACAAPIAVWLQVETWLAGWPPGAALTWIALALGGFVWFVILILCAFIAVRRPGTYAGALVPVFALSAIPRDDVSILSLLRLLGAPFAATGDALIVTGADRPSLPLTDIAEVAAGWAAWLPLSLIAWAVTGGGVLIAARRSWDPRCDGTPVRWPLAAGIMSVAGCAWLGAALDLDPSLISVATDTGAATAGEATPFHDNVTFLVVASLMVVLAGRATSDAWLAFAAGHRSWRTTSSIPFAAALAVILVGCFVATGAVEGASFDFGMSRGLIAGAAVICAALALDAGAMTTSQRAAIGSAVFGALAVVLPMGWHAVRGSPSESFPSLPGALATAVRPEAPAAAVQASLAVSVLALLVVGAACAVSFARMRRLGVLALASPWLTQLERDTTRMVLDLLRVRSPIIRTLWLQFVRSYMVLATLVSAIVGAVLVMVALSMPVPSATVPGLSEFAATGLLVGIVLATCAIIASKGYDGSIERDMNGMRPAQWVAFDHAVGAIAIAATSVLPAVVIIALATADAAPQALPTLGAKLLIALVIGAAVSMCIAATPAVATNPRRGAAFSLVVALWLAGMQVALAVLTRDEWIYDTANERLTSFALMLAPFGQVFSADNVSEFEVTRSTLVSLVVGVSAFLVAREGTRPRTALPTVRRAALLGWLAIVGVYLIEPLLGRGPGDFVLGDNLAAGALCCSLLVAAFGPIEARLVRLHPERATSVIPFALALLVGLLGLLAAWAIPQLGSPWLDPSEIWAAALGLSWLMLMMAMLRDMASMAPLAFRWRWQAAIVGLVAAASGPLSAPLVAGPTWAAQVDYPWSPFVPAVALLYPAEGPVWAANEPSEPLSMALFFAAALALHTWMRRRVRARLRT